MKTVFQYFLLALVFWTGQVSIGWSAGTVERQDISLESAAVKSDVSFQGSAHIPTHYIFSADSSLSTDDLFDLQEEEESAHDGEDYSSQGNSGNYNCFKASGQYTVHCHCTSFNRSQNRWNHQNIPWFQVIEVFRI